MVSFNVKSYPASKILEIRPMSLEPEYASNSSLGRFLNHHYIITLSPSEYLHLKSLCDRYIKN